MFDDFARKTVPDSWSSIQKKISDQASACTQREDREWKYQKKSVAGGLVYTCMWYVAVLKSVLLSHLLSFYTFTNYFVLLSLTVLVCFTCMCECVQV